MKRPLYSWLASGVLLGVFLVLGVIMTTPLAQADTLSRLSVLVGLVLGTSSLLAFFGLEFRRALMRTPITTPVATQAVRQGVELAVFLIGWMLLRMYTELHIWEISLLCLALVSAEIALSSRRPTTSQGAL